MRSPTFQPNFAAVWRPTMAPCRSAIQAFFCSSGSVNSGYIRSMHSGSTGICMKKFFGSW